VVLGGFSIFVSDNACPVIDVAAVAMFANMLVVQQTGKGYYPGSAKIPEVSIPYRFLPLKIIFLFYYFINTRMYSYVIPLISSLSIKKLFTIINKI
jgi:hypothetical protein